jgi:hypothetical protein
MGRESFEKRARERKRQERSAAKRERRDTRGESETTEDAVDSAELFERFRVLSEQFAAGEIDADTHEEQRLEIFNALGLESASGS